MTWAYSGSDQVQVDLFDIRPPDEALPQAEPPLAEAGLFAEETLSAVEERAEDRAMALTAKLYNSAPEPAQARPSSAAMCGATGLGLTSLPHLTCTFF